MYTRAVADRPDSEIVALCDVNSERIKVHQGLLKELKQPAAKEYHAVSSPITMPDSFHDMFREPPCWVILSRKGLAMSFPLLDCRSRSDADNVIRTTSRKCSQSANSTSWLSLPSMQPTTYISCLLLRLGSGS